MRYHGAASLIHCLSYPNSAWFIELLKWDERVMRCMVQGMLYSKGLFCLISAIHFVHRKWLPGWTVSAKWPTPLPFRQKMKRLVTDWLAPFFLSQADLYVWWNWLVRRPLMSGNRNLNRFLSFNSIMGVSRSLMNMWLEMFVIRSDNTRIWADHWDATSRLRFLAEGHRAGAIVGRLDFTVNGYRIVR